MRDGLAILLLLVGLMCLSGPAEGKQLLSDEELDEVSASGVTIDFDVADPTKFTFGFDAGGNTGIGNVTISAPTSLPSTLVFQGNTNLANAQFYVENMIFNLNICAGCQATTIIQQGTGIPVTIKVQP